MKQLVKQLVGRKAIDHTKHARDQIKSKAIHAFNKIFGHSKIDLGAGADADAPSWWTGDVQTGFIFDETTTLPLKSNSISFAYSSMFFEHLTNTTAANLLKEVARVLRPSACLRIVVPDFGKYIQKYHAGDRSYFYSENNPNFKTWASNDVPLDMEHLLVGMISAIHNLPHEMVAYPSLEDFSALPPKVCYPFQTRLSGYYCGPAPELTTAEIKERLSSQSEKDFVSWVFDVTNKSIHQDPTFNSWHKNQWDLEKLSAYAVAAGFSKVELSKFGEAPHCPGPKREKPQHEALGIYFNLFN